MLIYFTHFTKVINFRLDYLDREKQVKQSVLTKLINLRFSSYFDYLRKSTYIFSKKIVIAYIILKKLD